MAEQVIQSYSDLQALLAAPTPCSGVVVAPVVVPANLTVPVGVFLRFAAPGQLQPAAGTTLTLQGHVEAPPYQIFGGAGRAQLANEDVQEEAWVEWWGAVADGDFSNHGTDNSAAINAAILALPAWGGKVTLRFAGHVYRVGSTLNVINNSANNHRKGLRLLGKGWGRRGLDANLGTYLIWGGNATDPLLKLHSSNCRVEGLTFACAFANNPDGSQMSLARAVDVDAPSSETIENIITENHFLRVVVDGQLGPVTDGIVLGASNIQNNEFHLFESCQFRRCVNHGVWQASGTGQAKNYEFRDSEFEDCGIGVAMSTGSATFLVCNWNNCNPGVYMGGSFEPVNFLGCSSENCPQMISCAGTMPGLNVVGCRFSANAIPPAPARGQEFLYGGTHMNVTGCVFDDDRPGFLIRPQDGGLVTFTGMSFASSAPLPTDWSTTWTGFFAGLMVGGQLADHGAHWDRDKKVPLSAPGLVLNDGIVEDSGWGGPAGPRPTASYFEREGHYQTTLLSENGGRKRQVVTLQRSNDVWGGSPTFLSGQGNVPPSPPSGYSWAVAYVTPDGEAPPDVFQQQIHSSQAGGWQLAVPLGPAGVTARKVYRGTIDQPFSQWGLVGTVSDNTTALWIDTTATPGSAPPTTGLVSYVSVGFGSYTPGMAVVSAAPPSIAPSGYLVQLVNGRSVKVPFYG